MRQQSLITDMEIVRGMNARGHATEVVVAVLPVLQPFAVRGLQTGIEHCLMESLNAGLGELVVEVDLRDLMRIAEVLVLSHICGLLHRGHGDLVGTDVIGVRIAAIFVVRGDDLWAELTDMTNERRAELVQWSRSEGVRRQRRLGVTLGEPGVLEAEPGVLDPENLCGLCHLALADGMNALCVDSVLHRRIEDVAALATGARDDHHLDALIDVLRRGSSALGGLVVRMSVNRH